MLPSTDAPESNSNWTFSTADVTGNKGLAQRGQSGPLRAFITVALFTPLSGLGTVAFSVDNVGDGTYTAPGDTLNVYHLRIVGNYAASTPYVDIYASDANGMNLDHQALSQTYWVGSSPVSGQSTPETVAFYNYTAPVLLGQINLGSGLRGQPLLNIALLGNRIVGLSCTNGFPGDTCYLLTSPNPAAAPEQLDARSDEHI